MKPTSRVSQLVAMVFLAVVGTGAPAESAEPPAPPTPPVEEVGRTLSGAKKDFEVVKSLREHGADAKNDSSRLVLPRMPSAPVPAVSGSPRPDLSKDSKPGANWLVDAMQKRELGKQPRSDERRDLDTKSEDRPGREGEQTSPLREHERNGRVPPPNPFTPYMQGWISPVDLPLLRPALESSRALPRPGAESGANTKEFGVAGVREELDWRSGNLPATSKMTGSGAVNPARENPYLLNLEKEAVVTSGPAVSARPSAGPAVVISPPSALVRIPPPTAAATPSQSRIPDFVRPNADDKYFKPLKRF